MSLDAADMNAFFSDFATTITPVTWGTGEFAGIVDQIEVETPSAGGVMTTRWRTTITAPAAVVPDTAAVGDLFRWGTVAYKAVEYRYNEPGLVLIVLGRTV